METQQKPIVASLMEAMERGDREEVERLVHEDIVMEWPQSGERFVGRDNALAAMGAAPEKPEPAGEPRIVGCDDMTVLMMPLRYGSEISHYVGVFELDGGRVRRTTEYFGAPFPAVEARAPYADRT